MADLKLTPAQAQRLRRLLQGVVEFQCPRCDATGFGFSHEAGELLPDLFTVREAAIPRARNPSPAPRGETKAARHRRILAEVRERDGGRCCAKGFAGIRCRGMLHGDHFFGRARDELEEAPLLWQLCAAHHELKGLGRPTRIAWLELFRRHCQRHSYEAEIARVDGLLAIERVQHPEHQEVTG